MVVSVEILVPLSRLVDLVVMVRADPLASVEKAKAVRLDPLVGSLALAVKDTAVQPNPRVDFLASAANNLVLMAHSLRLSPAEGSVDSQVTQLLPLGSRPCIVPKW